MFVLVSYSNDPYIQDIFYDGKFTTEIGVCRELNEWIDSFFGENGEGIVIDSIPLFGGQTVEKEGKDGFFISMFYDDNGYDNDSSMSYVHGIMGYHDDFRLTFCIVEV